MIDAFRENGGDKPAYLQVHLSWAESEEAALEIARHRPGAAPRQRAGVGQPPERGVATGVALADGTEFRANRVVSGADANVTFNKLMDAKDLPADFLSAVNRIDYSSATVKMLDIRCSSPSFTS